jgi:hypothetical protein
VRRAWTRSVEAARWALLVIALGVLFTPAVRKTVYSSRTPGDFQWHARSAERLRHGGGIETPHMAYALLLAGLGFLLEERTPGPAIDARRAVALAVLGLHVASGVVFLVHPLWW